MAITRRAAGVLIVLTGCAPATNYESNTGPRYAWTAPPAPDLEPGLRVATFNIRYARDVEGALAAIRADAHLKNADVLALQEMDAPGVDALGRGLGMSYVYYPAAVHPTGGKDFGNAVLVRGRIEKDGKLFLPHLSAGRAMQRIAVWADVDVDGARFRVYSMHISADAEMSPRLRLDQVRAVITAAEDRKAVVVAGDFNERGQVGHAFEDAGYEWVSRDLPPTVSHLFAWDHIFARGLRLVALDRRGVAGNGGSSDHLPVWADLAPSTARRTTSTPSR